MRTPRDNAQDRARAYVIQWLMRRLYPGADRVVALCDAIARTLKEHRICSGERIRVIGNPVTIFYSDCEGRVESTFQQSIHGRYICAIGRLTEQKGFDVLLDAFARLPDHDLHLVVLGQGPLRNDLEEQARRLGVAQRVHLPGFVPQPRNILASAELFVLSSRWEGFPNVLVEALAVGTPIVATDCLGAPREILQDGVFGHLVPTEDPQALAGAIEEALNLPRSTKSARRSRAEDFAAPVIAMQYLTEAFGLKADGRDYVGRPDE